SLPPPPPQEQFPPSYPISPPMQDASSGMELTGMPAGMSPPPLGGPPPMMPSQMQPPGQPPPPRGAGWKRPLWIGGLLGGLLAIAGTVVLVNMARKRNAAQSAPTAVAVAIATAP